MKKKLLLIILFALLIITCAFLAIKFEPVVRQKVFKQMTVEEFLHDKNPNRHNELYLNKDRLVEYKGMVIIRDNDHKPLSNETAYYDDEIIIYLRATGIKPETQGCDQSDRAKNGTLGCYLLAPQEKND